MAKPRRMRAYPVTVARARRQAEMEQTMRTWSEQLARIKEFETLHNGAIDDVMRAEADRDSQRRRGNAYRNRALALMRHARKWRGEVRKCSDFLGGSVVRMREYADAADERADAAEARAASLEADLAQARALLGRARLHVRPDDDPILWAEIDAALLAAHPAPAAGEMNDG